MLIKLKLVYTKVVQVLSHLGEKKLMNCGMYATVVVYNCWRDISVEFEDGTIVSNRTYSNFLSGTIRNPNISNIQIKDKERLNENKYMINGMFAIVKDYKDSKHIDIEFEDGTLVEDRDYNAFKKGLISNPNLKRNGKVGNFIVYDKYYINLERKIVLYSCRCEKCGYESLLSPQSMLKHVCHKNLL